MDYVVVFIVVISPGGRPVRRLTWKFMTSSVRGVGSVLFYQKWNMLCQDLFSFQYSVQGHAIANASSDLFHWNQLLLLVDSLCLGRPGLYWAILLLVCPLHEDMTKGRHLVNEQTSDSRNEQMQTKTQSEGRTRKRIQGLEPRRVEGT